MTGLQRRLREYVLLTRLDRPIGILLLLWPVLWALWLASNGLPEPKLLVIFVLGTVHPPSDYDWRKDPDKERVPEGYASDHYPVAIDLMPERKAAPAKDAGAADGAAK